MTTKKIQWLDCVRQTVLRLLLTAASLFASPVVLADPSCLQSFNVKADTTVSNFGWLPGATTKNIGTLNCRSLELSRQDYFVSNEKFIDIAMLEKSQSYTAEIDQTLARLEKTQAELQKKLEQDAAIDALRIIYRVLKFEFGKASALIGCFAPEPSASKVVCAIGLAILADDTTSVLDGSIAKTEISERAKKLISKTTELKVQYETLKKLAPKFDMNYSRQQHTKVFIGMCEAVRSNCL